MAFCFSAFPLLFAFLTSGGARETRKPLLPSSPAPLRQPPRRLAPGSLPGEGEEPDPRGAAPPGPCGERAEGKLFLPRLLGCLWPRAHFSDLIPSALRSADPEGAARGRVEARCCPSPGCLFPVSSSGFQSPPKGVWLAGCQAVGRDQGRSGRQTATSKALRLRL